MKDTIMDVVLADSFVEESSLHDSSTENYLGRRCQKADIYRNEIDLENKVETGISPQDFFNIKEISWMPDGKYLLLAALVNLGENLIKFGEFPTKPARLKH